MQGINAALPLVRVYVDETGDRAFGQKCSPMFAISAVMVEDEHDHELRAAVKYLRGKFGVEGVPLRWSTHCGPSHHDRRRHIARTLGRVPSVQLTYVVLDKANIPAQAALRTDRAIAYNFVAKLLCERVALAADKWPGGQRRARVQLAHVKGHNHPALLRYLGTICPGLRDAGSVPWYLIGSIDINSPATIVGLEAADLYSGIFSSAVRPDKFGHTDHGHLLQVAHQLRRRWDGRVLGWGIKVLGNGSSDLVTKREWWPLLEGQIAA